jgi:hypothetical protein
MKNTHDATDKHHFSMVQHYVNLARFEKNQALKPSHLVAARAEANFIVDPGLRGQAINLISSVL